MPARTVCKGAVRPKGAQGWEQQTTDDGVPYWYNRRTGETFWEEPAHDDDNPDDINDMLIAKEEDKGHISGKDYSLESLRAYMLKNHDEEEKLDAERAQLRL